jgi:hypothetical protein
MTKDLDIPVLDLEGEQVIDRVKGVDRPATIKNFIVNALALVNGEQIPGDEKMQRYKLAKRLNDGGQQEFTAEEISVIKNVVGVMYSPLIVGQVYEWADSGKEAGNGGGNSSHR